MARPAGITQETIVEAAVSLADEHGFDGLTLAGVAAELGVQPPSLYHHIDGLEGIRRAVVWAGLAVLGEINEQARDGRQGSRALVAYAQAQRDFARTRPGLYAAVNATNDMADDPELWSALLQAIAPALDTLAESGIDQDSVLEALRLFRAALHGFLVLELRGDFRFDLDVDASYDRLVEVVLSGLRAEFGADAS